MIKPFTITSLEWGNTDGWYVDSETYGQTQFLYYTDGYTSFRLHDYPELEQFLLRDFPELFISIPVRDPDIPF